MTKVAPIHTAYNPKTLWFDPQDFEIAKGDAVVVNTARGLEFGRAAGDLLEVDEAQIKALKTPLKPVERLATEEDIEKAAELEQQGREALPLFKEMVEESGVEMHPVAVEFLFDGDKAVFYFESEERVDFRDLVRKLASHFHVRVDMRQIGVRDEARMVGGLGHCGQELCCKRLGGEFCPVSIRMAKEQDLSLNPQKISGLCGRLMCCLRHEFDAYKDFKSRSPKVGATVTTPDGPAKVVDLDVPREMVSVRIEGEKPVRIPIAGFEKKEDGSRPSVVTEEAWTAANDETQARIGGESALFSTSQFTGADKLAEAGAVRRTPSRKKAQAGGASAAGQGKGSGDRSRRGRQEKATVKPAERKPRRRSTTLSADGAVAHEGQEHQRSRTQKSAETRGGSSPASKRGRTQSTRGGGSSRQESAEKRRTSEPKPRRQGQRTDGGEQPRKATRPGQRSSGLSRQEPQASKPAAASGAEGSQPSRRRRRRRNKPAGEGQE